MKRNSHSRKLPRHRSGAGGHAVEALDRRVLLTAFYVDSGAADGGDGSAASPWNQLSSVSAFGGFHQGDVLNLIGSFNNQTLTLGGAAAGITVTSNPADPATIVEPASLVFLAAITVSASGITISNLNLVGPGVNASSNSYYGICLDNTGTTQFTNDAVTNVSATGFVWAGLEIQGGSNGFSGASVTNSNFSSNQVAGINVEGPGSGYVHGNLTISNCITSNNSGDAIYWSATHPGQNEDSASGGIFVSSVDGAVVDHCTAINNDYDAASAAGIWAANATNVDFEYCESAGTVTNVLYADGDGFDFDHGVTDSIMQYDYSHGNWGSGYLLCTYPGLTSDVGDTIRYCVSDDDALYNGAGITIYNFSQDLIPHPVADANICNNTVVESSYYASCIAIDGLTPTAAGYCTVNILNNIFYNDTTYSAYSALVDCSFYTPQLSNVVFQGNDYWSPVMPNKFRVRWGSVNYDTMSSWIAATGEEMLNGVVVALNQDPMLVNDTGNPPAVSSLSGLQPTAGSPLVGAGLDLSAAPFSSSAPYTNGAPYDLTDAAWSSTGGHDYFGNPIVPGGSHNIGFSQASTLVFNGSSSGDAWVLQEDPALPNTLDVNSATYSLQGVDSVIIDGSTGNESVTCNFANGPLSNANGPLAQSGLTFNGGTANNSLTVENTGSAVAGTMPIFFNPAVGSSNTIDASFGQITIPAGTQTGITTDVFSNITITAGAEVALANSLTGPANRTLLVVTGDLSIAGSTNAWTGTLDLGGNDMDIKNGSLGTLTNQIAQGFNDGWQSNGGIISSTAAADTTHLTTLGVIQNTILGNSSQPLYTTFDTQPVAATDVLIKYTKFGDANLDGVVDGSDYSLIDNGLAMQLTGWANGDFNYDGVINGADYTLMDNAYNSLTASPAAQIAASPTDAVATASPNQHLPVPTMHGDESVLPAPEIRTTLQRSEPLPDVSSPPEQTGPTAPPGRLSPTLLKPGNRKQISRRVKSQAVRTDWNNDLGHALARVWTISTKQ